MLRPWIDLAGSGQFFSRWSWLATLPLAVTVLGGYDAATDARGRLLGFGFALLVHAMLGVTGILCARIERRMRSRKARVGAVIVSLALIGVLRPLLLAGLAAWSGTTLYDGPLGARIATNLVGATVLLTVVAQLVTTTRRQRAATARLRTVRQALSEQRARDHRDVAELTRETLAAVRGAVDAHLSAGRGRTAGPEDAAVTVRRLSEEVIRPLSHALHDESEVAPVAPLAPLAPDVRATATTATTAAATADPGRTAAARGRLGPIRLHPAPVWTTGIAYASLWVPFAASRFPLAAVLVALLAVVLVAAAGNAAATVLWRRTRPRSRTAVLVGTAAVTGSAIAGSSAAILSIAGVVAVPVVHVLAYPLFVSLVAIARAALRRFGTAEAAAARAVDDAYALALRERNRLVLARRRVAHLLHVEVQAACVSAALTLARAPSPASGSGSDARGSDARDSDAREAIIRIVALLDDERPTDQPSARDAVESIVAAWRYALDLTLHVDDGAWEVLDADPARRALAVDALSEALTNVARHAAEPRATIALRLTPTVDNRTGPGRVVLDVRSTGPIPADPTDGYGLRQLRRRSLSVSLTAMQGDARLQVALP